MLISNTHDCQGLVQNQEHLLRRNVKRFRGGLVFKAHRLLYHSTLDSKVIIKNRAPCSEVGHGNNDVLVKVTVVVHQLNKSTFSLFPWQISLHTARCRGYSAII